MKLRTERNRKVPELNIIPMIDIMFFLLVLECLIVMMISPDKALADVNFKSVLLDVNALLESATSSVPPTVTVAVQLFASFVLHVNPTDWTFSV